MKKKAGRRTPPVTTRSEMTIPEARVLIRNIWKIYSPKVPTRAQEDQILRKSKPIAKDGGYKLGTVVSWVTRVTLHKMPTVRKKMASKRRGSSSK